ncbi:MAG TPA: YlbF family regulator [Longimicrobiaceae bacterium]|nr:YlbF family regulator [Longimicrobiaceae bacterium]
MDAIWDKARDVGRLLAQSSEYGALKRANERLADDRETVTRINRLNALEEAFTVALRSGAEPEQAEQEEYERLAGEIQESATYRTYEIARTNFDKLMLRVNEEIGKGIQAGEQSRIILSS